MNKFKILLVSISLILLFAGENVYSQEQNKDFKMGMIQMVTGKNSTAISSFSKAIAVDKNLIDAYYNRGICYQKINEIDKALADFSTVIDKDKFMPEAFNNRGLIYFKAKNYKKAIADFNESAKLNPEYPFTYLYLSNSYMEINNYSLALEKATIVLSYLPNYVYAHKNAAYASFELKKYQSALNHANLIIDKFPKNDKFYLLRARVYKAQKDNEAACKDYVKAAELGNINAKVEKTSICK